MSTLPRKKMHAEEGTFDSSKYSEIYSKLAKDRIIFLAEDITKETGSYLSALLLYYDHENDQEDIKIYINSNGGDATALSNIYDVMRMINSPVQTICIGKAYSAAAILLAAGTKGKRFATKNSDIMIHGLQVQFPFSENSDKIDIEIDLRMLETHNTLLMKILSAHTGKDHLQIAKDCQRDLFMGPRQALDYGIIDQII